MSTGKPGPLARARFRRQNAPLQFAFGDRIDFLNGAHWDEVTAHRGTLLQRAYFRELESALPDNLDVRYALLYRERQPVAALAMQLVQVHGARLTKAETEPKKGLRALAARGVAGLGKRLGARVLVIGNLLTYGSHGIAIVPRAQSDADIWHGIGEAAYRVRRAEKHSGSADFVLVKDLTADELQQSAMLRELGYRTIETEPNMVLDVRAEWRAHDDYLAALVGKYRKNVRGRVLAPIEAAGLRVAPLADVAAAADQLHALYLAVHENAAVRPVTLAPAYWPALARAAGERVRFLGLWRGEQLLGFVVTLRDDDATAIAYHIGFDRQVAQELPLYLRLLHGSIADAIVMGCRKVSFGRTALEPKAMLGAKPQPLHVWVRHRQPVLNKLLRGLLGRVHHDEAPVRNAFPSPAQ